MGVRRLCCFLSLAWALLATGACKDDAPTTGVTLTISILARNVAVDELRIRAELPGRAPRETRRPVGSAKESESVNLVFEPEAGGDEVTLIVEALAAGTSQLTGRSRVRLVKGEFVAAEVRLASCAAPDGPFCDADTLVDCDASRTSTSRTVCEHGCNADAGRCNSCDAGLPSCDGDTFVRCGEDGLPLATEDCAAAGDTCRQGSCSLSGCITLAANDGASCDDGRFCVENTTCSAGACGGGTPRDCGDTNTCTFDTCDETADACVHDAAANDGEPCQTAVRCLVQQECSGGVCGGGTPRPCTDDNPCTVDACDEVSGCTHVDKSDGTPCEDADFCSLGDTCQTGQCAPGLQSPCTDANPCTTDACDEVNDACTYDFVAAGTLCLDAVTQTSCDGAGGASNFICAFGCNGARDQCNECDPDPARVVTCHADVENLCNAEFTCSPAGLVVFKACCASNQCTCDGALCLEDVCGAAPELGGGGTLTGDTCDALDNVPGDCNPGGVACRTVAQGGSPEEMFRLTLDDGLATSRFYNVTIDGTASAAATDLRLSTVCGNESLQLPNAEVCAVPVGLPERTCLKTPGADALLLCGIPEGAYFGAVESEAGSCGAYDVDVSVAPATLDVAAQAGNISRGGVFTGTTCGLTDDFTYPVLATISGCDGVADCAAGQCPACSAAAATNCRVPSMESLCAHSGAASPDAVFYLALTVDSGIDISTEGSRFDTVLYITQAGPGGAANPAGSVRVCNDDCLVADGPSHIQTSLPAGLYYVFLDGAGGDCGEYRLTVTVAPSATCPNLSCETPSENCETCPGDCRCLHCGDGAIQPWEGETCDDGGTSGSDGCGTACVVEDDWKCSGEPSVCVPACGDGVVDRERGEQCDDGNTIDGDGCTSSCQQQSGYVCDGAPSVCAPGLRVSVCPGAAIPTSAAGLSSTLAVGTVGNIFDVTADVSVTHTWIGDLTVDLTSPGGTTVRLHNATGGSTDDLRGNYDMTLVPDGPGTMNSFNGQAMNGTWTLKVVDGYPSSDFGTLDCWGLNLRWVAVCGTGTCEAQQETCASCAADCPCTGCGNGLVQAAQGEVCDDGDTTGGDGCSSLCVVESGFKCSGQPSVCIPKCGDGVLDAGEGCDDGDVSAGDGCGATCAVEATYLCEGEPSVCVHGQRVAACPNVAIPDKPPSGPNPGVSNTLTATTACPLANVTVDVDIAHTFIGDLTVDLRSPANTTLRLHNLTGSSTDDIVGNYDLTLTPAGAAGMNVFNGQASNGGWRMSIVDTVTADTGTLRCWAVNLYCQ